MDLRYVGLNATARTIEVAVRPTGENWETDFADECITQTATKLRSIEPELVVMEGTGTFELPVAGVFATLGLPIAIVNPLSVREFARAVGRMTRVPFTPAGLLAHFGELAHPEPRPLPDDLVSKLKGIRSRREEVLQMLGVERDRLKVIGPSEVLRKDLQRHIDFLEKSAVALDVDFNRTVRCSVAWR